MPEMIQGAFHFHSTYSHDGRSTLFEIASALRSRGFSFCIQTEHFEDFDASKFDNYLREARETSSKTGICLIPGVEINLSGLDTILFPVADYSEVARFARNEKNSACSSCKVLAHPSKYPFQAVVKHLENYELQGVELWNQQADGSHLPPFEFLCMWQSYSRRNQYRYFFGCDLHNVNLTVANMISLCAPTQPGVETIVQKLTAGKFISRNLPTGVEYRNGLQSDEFDPWLRNLQTKSYYRGRLLRGVRSGLKSAYRVLPRDMQKSLNDVKNFVRNKV